MDEEKKASISLDFYDRDQELDVEVDYKLEMEEEGEGSRVGEELSENVNDEASTSASSFPSSTFRSRPNQLRDLEIDLDMDSSNRAMESIEKQSPIIERELLTTEQQLENFRSRLAMSESVSAVTQSVLESIRREYNLPESNDDEDEEPIMGVKTTSKSDNDNESDVNTTRRDYDEEDDVPNSSSNDEGVDYHHEKEADIIAGDESLLTSSSGNENEPESLLKEETVKILSDVNQEMQEKLEQIEGKLREKQVQDVIERFAKESQSQIEKIMMIQSLEEPDEVEDEAVIIAQAHSSDDSSKAHDVQRKLSLSQTQLIEDASESDSAPIVDDLNLSRKLSISQTKLIEEEASESGEEMKPMIVDTLTPAARKLSISQTRLIEEEVSESDSAKEQAATAELIAEEDRLCEEKPYDQIGVLSKSRQYQTFESSSSTNSELNKQDDFRHQSKGRRDDDDDDDELGGDGTRVAVSTAPDMEIPSKIEEEEPTNWLMQPIVVTKVSPASISYSSGEVSSESIAEAAVTGRLVEPSCFLNVSPGIKESESRELLLDDEAKIDDDDEEEELEATVSIESASTSQRLLEPSSQAIDGSNEDVSIATVIERRRASDEASGKVSKQASLSREKKESSTEISSEAYETDEENRPIATGIPGIEATTLLSSSDDHEDEERETGLKSDGSSENLEVCVDFVTEESVVIEKAAPKSSLYLDLAPAVKSESREPLITEQPMVEEFTLEEVVEYPNDSPPLMYENSSCGASLTSCSTMSEENLVKPVSNSGDEANIDQQLSKSLTYLESLMVPASTAEFIEKSTGSELFYKAIDEKSDTFIESEQFGGSHGSELNDDTYAIRRHSQSLNFGQSEANVAVRPVSFTVRGDELLSSEQLEQEQQTPTPVENMAGDFFDKRITSSNEPSIDRLTSVSEGCQVRNQESVREISNESLASYEGVKSETEEIEAKAAIATALLFSSTIQSQSSDEVKSIASVQHAKQADDEESEFFNEDIQS